MVKIMAVEKLSIVQQAAGRYFNYDTWTIHDGLLLLAGILPEKALIRSSDKYTEKHIKDKRDNLEIVEAALIDHYHKPLGNARRELLKKIVLHHGELEFSKQDIQNLKNRTEEIRELEPNQDFSDFYEHQVAQQAHLNGFFKISTQDLNQAKDRLKEYVRIEAALNHFCAIWHSGKHTKPRYSPSYFINWAEGKGVDLTWYDNIARTLNLPTGPSTTEKQTEVLQSHFSSVVKMIDELDIGNACLEIANHLATKPEKVNRMLTDCNFDPQQRANAANAIWQQINQTNPKLAEQWCRIAQDAINNRAPIGIDGLFSIFRQNSEQAIAKGIISKGEILIKQRRLTSEMNAQLQQNDLNVPAAENNYITGQADLCRAFGLSPTSFDAVRRRVKRAKMEFEREIEGDETSSPRLKAPDIIIIKDRWKKKEQQN